MNSLEDMLSTAVIPRPDVDTTQVIPPVTTGKIYKSKNSRYQGRHRKRMRHELASLLNELPLVPVILILVGSFWLIGAICSIIAIRALWPAN